MSRISASVLRPLRAARSFKARCVSSGRLRMVTAAIVLNPLLQQEPIPRRKSWYQNSRPPPFSHLPSHLDRERIFERDLLQALEAARSAAVAGVHVGLEQDRRAAGGL